MIPRFVCTANVVGTNSVKYYIVSMVGILTVIIEQLTVTIISIFN